MEDKYQLYPHKENGGYAFTWGMKYGRKTTSLIGILAHVRAGQLVDTEAGRAYRDLSLQAARKYLTTDPKREDRPWPAELGMAIFLQLAANTGFQN